MVVFFSVLQAFVSVGSKTSCRGLGLASLDGWSACLLHTCTPSNHLINTPVFPPLAARLFPLVAIYLHLTHLCLHLPQPLPWAPTPPPAVPLAWAIIYNPDLLSKPINSFKPFLYLGVCFWVQYTILQIVTQCLIWKHQQWVGGTICSLCVV